MASLGEPWNLRRAALLAIAIVLAGGLVGYAQRQMRRHTATEARPVRLIPATQPSPGKSDPQFVESGESRQVTANGMPGHKVGRFPNQGNPNRISEQRYRFRLPLNPQPANEITPLHNTSRLGPPGMPFGIAVNGVLFDPGAAEYWQGDRTSGWNYEALSGAVPLGVDENHAHVQPTGAYHYHGLPTLLLHSLGLKPSEHSPLVGWAADGFPIYCQYGYRDPMDSSSEVVEQTSSFRLKEGNRPGGANAPSGKHDGAFVQDYEYVAGAGTLDECNGRRCVTPEFPSGTYAYFLTEDWPIVPRAFRGKPVNLRGRP